MSVYGIVSTELDEISLGEHLCHFYKSKKEQLANVVPFLKSGLEKNEKCVYVLDKVSKEDMIETLSKEIDIKNYVKSNKFLFLTKEETYLKEGSFDPDLIIDFFKEMEEKALEEGFLGLRIIVEMTCISSKKHGVDRVLEYEAKLNNYLQTSKSIVLCLYNEKIFEPNLLLDVIYTHPTLLMANKIVENQQNVRPEEYLVRLNGEITLATFETVKEDIFHKNELFREFKLARDTMMISYHFLDLCNKHTKMSPLLEELVEEIMRFSGCDSVGIRLLDEEDNIPYEAYKGFSKKFYESESPLSLKNDKCICINVIKGETNSKLDFYTEGGSFYTNCTTELLASVSEEKKGETRNVCNKMGYESVVLIPIRFGKTVLGLIHIADPRRNMIPYELVFRLEIVAKHLYQSLIRVKAEEALLEAHDNLELRVRERTETLIDVNTKLEQEILDRKTAAIALLESEERYKTLFNKAADMIFLLEIPEDLRPPTILEVNDTACQKLGFSREELLSMTLFDLDPLIDKETMAKLKDVVKETGMLSMESVLKTKDDGRIPVDIRSHAYHIGDTWVLQSVARDITERIQAEEELIKSEAQYSVLFNEMLDGFAYHKMIYNKKGIPIDFEYIEINDSFEKLTGLKRENVIGKRVTEVFPSKDKDSVDLIEIYGEVAKTGKPIQFEHYSEQLERWLLISVYSLKQNYFAIIFKDITESREMDETLKKSETKFRELFNNMSSGVAVYDTINDGKDFVFVDFNKAGEKIDQINLKEIIGRKVSEVFPGGKDFGVFDVFKRVWKTGKPEKHPVTFYHDNRISGWRENYVYKLPTGEIVTVYDDVTEQKQAEEGLKLSEERVRKAEKIAKIGEFEVDLTTKKVHLSKALFEIFEFKKEIDATNFNLLQEFIHPEDRERVNTELIQAIENKTLLDCDYRVILPDGQVKVVKEKSEVIYEDSGKPIKIIGMIQDITEQREVEEALKESEGKYRALFNQAVDSIVLIDFETGELVDFNEAAHLNLGYTRKEFEKLTIQDFEILETPEEVNNHMIQILKEGSDIFETEHKTKNGEIRTIIVSSKAIEIKDKNYIQSTFRDITEREAAERRLEESEQRIRHIMEGVPIGITLSDQEGNIFDANSTMWKMLGLETKEAFLQTNAKDFYYDLKDRKTFVEQLETEGEVQELVCQFQSKDGSVFWGSLCSVADPKITGEIRYITTLKNITESKKAEEEIIRGQREKSSILDGIDDHIVYYDNPEMKIVWANKTAAKDLGLNIIQIKGEFCYKLWHQKEEPCKDCPVIKSFKTGQLEEAETTTPDGREWLIKGNPIKDEQGKVIGVVEVTHNITERKKSLDKIKQSEEQLRNLMNNVPVGIAINSHDKKLIDINPTFWKIFGFDSKEEFNKANAPGSLYSFEDRKKIYNLLNSKGYVKNFEMKLTKKDGSTIWGSVSSVEHILPSGEINYIHILQDITSQKEEEKKLMKQVLKFRLEEGELHLVKETYPRIVTEVLLDFQKVGYKRIVISRTPKNEWNKMLDNDTDIFWLSEKVDNSNLQPDFQQLEKYISELPRRCVLLVDRLDYLIEINGFKTTLRFIYRLKEIASLSDLIVILSIDPQTLDSRELSLLEKETQEVEQRSVRRLPDDIYEILKFIDHENAVGVKPSYTEIGNEFNISRPTTRTKIRNLTEIGYLKESLIGRSKVLEVTEKGKLLL